MNFILFAKGILIGVFMSVPAGPVGLLCIQRTLQFGRFSGLSSGLGAVFTDVVYAFMTIFGFTVVSDFFLSFQFWLRLGGSIFLFYMGWKILNSKPLLHTPLLRKISPKKFFNDFISIFFLALVNPSTPLSFVAVPAALGVVFIQKNFSEYAAFVGGIVIGSSISWIVLTESVVLFHKKINSTVIYRIHQIGGLLILGMGMGVLLSLFLT